MRVIKTDRSEFIKDELLDIIESKKESKNSLGIYNNLYCYKNLKAGVIDCINVPLFKGNINNELFIQKRKNSNMIYLTALNAFSIINEENRKSWENMSFNDIENNSTYHNNYFSKRKIAFISFIFSLFNDVLEQQINETLSPNFKISGSMLLDRNNKNFNSNGRMNFEFILMVTQNSPIKLNNQLIGIKYIDSVTQGLKDNLSKKEQELNLNN